MVAFYCLLCVSSFNKFRLKWFFARHHKLLHLKIAEIALPLSVSLSLSISLPFTSFYCGSANAPSLVCLVCFWLCDPLLIASTPFSLHWNKCYFTYSSNCEILIIIDIVLLWTETQRDMEMHHEIQASRTALEESERAQETNIWLMYQLFNRNHNI